MLLFQAFSDLRRKGTGMQKSIINYISKYVISGLLSNIFWEVAKNLYNRLSSAELFYFS